MYQVHIKVSSKPDWKFNASLDLVSNKQKTKQQQQKKKKQGLVVKRKRGGELDMAVHLGGRGRWISDFQVYVLNSRPAEAL